MGFTSPNYTQTPNDLFDCHMAKLSEAELRVALAVIRGTFGYHRNEFTCSIKGMMTITGLSYNGVTEATKRLEAMGLIERVVTGNKSGLWRAVVDPSASEGCTPQPVRGNPSASEGLSRLNKDKEIKLIEPLSEVQSLFLSTFGAKRFANKVQRDAVLKLEQTYGIDRLREPLQWAAKQGMGLGRAISAVEKATPKWGNPKTNGGNGYHPKSNVQQNFENIAEGLRRIKEKESSRVNP